MPKLTPEQTLVKSTKKLMKKKRFSRSAFKAVERAIALWLDGKRVPVTGRHSGDVEDVTHNIYAIEAKARASYPQVMTLAMTQAKRAAKATAKIPLVVIHKFNTDHKDDLVVMRMEDFTMFGPHMEILRQKKEQARSTPAL